MQSATRPADPALHRAHRAIADLGRFLVGEAARADEDRRLALFGRQHGQPLTQLVQRHRGLGIVHRHQGAFGGFLVDNSRGRTKVVSARGAFSSHPCIANVVIDGFSVKSDPDAFSVDDLLPLDVGAIEVYKEGESGPPEYDTGCGAIVIWTRR